jgi:hypothetical protein
MHDGVGRIEDSPVGAEDRIMNEAAADVETDKQLCSLCLCALLWS